MDKIDYTQSGSGPFGVRAEYMLEDQFGIGLDVGYNSTHAQYKEYNTDGNGNEGLYEYDFKTAKLGLMLTFNFHFLTTDQLDVFVAFGAGYGNRTYTYDSNEPGYTPETMNGLIPVALKGGTGIRYFFTENIGVNLTAQIGQGGIINGGLSFKF